MRRYNAPGYVFELPYAEGVRLLDYAQESENDLKLYARWVVGYQHASTFIEFKNKLMQGTKRDDDRSAEDILQSVEELLTRF